MDQGKYLMELQLLEGQANHFEEQLQIINQQVAELELLKKNITDFERAKNDEVFSEFGKGIFFKSKIEEKQLLVDVGAKILVPKSFEEVRQIIDEQIEKFEDVKPEIAESIEKINLRLDQIVNSAKNFKEESEKKEDKTLEKKEKNKKDKKN